MLTGLNGLIEPVNLVDDRLDAVLIEERVHAVEQGAWCHGNAPTC